MTNAAEIVPGGEATLALSTSGNVWSWGYNITGALGNGTYDPSNPTLFPLELVGISGVSDIASGLGHSLAVSNGFVYGWGDNSSGQLGGGLDSMQLAPALITGLSNVFRVEGSCTNSYALEDDGTVWSMGDNGMGELGIGTYSPTTGPVKVVGLSNIIAISASPYGNYCLALRNDGTVWSWGGNDGDFVQQTFGQLGDGADDPTNLPTKVIGLSNIVSISAGGIFAMALEGNGTVWGWGDNSFRELGNFGGSSTNAPVQILSPYFYVGQAPVLTISGGDAQAVSPNSFLTNPLLVSVTSTNGTPLTNAPVVFETSTQEFWPQRPMEFREVPSSF